MIWGICFFTTAYGMTPFLQGPHGWDRVSDIVSKKILMVFVGPKKGSLTPSLNLTTENTNLSLYEYVKLAMAHHQKEGASCYELDPLDTTLGQMILIEVQGDSHWGFVQMLQGIIIENNQAYVITGSCLSTEYSIYFKEFLSSMKEFNVIRLVDGD